MEKNKRKQTPSGRRLQWVVTRTSVLVHTCPISPSMASKGSRLNLQTFQSTQFDASVFQYEKNCGNKPRVTIW